MKPDLPAARFLPDAGMAFASHFPPAAPREPDCAVFLDRDGTINREVHYLSHPDQLELLPGSAPGLRALRSAGWRLVVVTNQSAIARGLIDRKRLGEIHDRLAEMLLAEGVEIAGWYACPHHPEAGCSCRKPGKGLFEQASRELEIRPERSWMVGDQLTDLQAGRAFGSRTILVATGYGSAQSRLPGRRDYADHYVASLTEAARIILRTDRVPAR